MKRAVAGGISGWTRSWHGIAAYAALYVALDWASYVHPVSPLGITPWNPSAGLSLFFLMQAGPRYWPAPFAAAFIADLVVRGAPAQFMAMLASAAMIALVYAVAAALLAGRLSRRSTLESPRDLAVFVLIVAPATLVLAVGFVGMYTALEAVPREDFLGNMLRYWVGDMNGILVLAPALLYHSGAGGARRPPLPVLGEAALQALAIVAVLWVLFAVADTYEVRFFSLLFLPLVWVAARWGLRGATLALVGIQVGLIVAVQLARYHSVTFVQLQFLMIALSITGLVLGAVVTQRQRIEARLRDKQAALNQALQLAAAGEMMSALAHELSQPIAALERYLGAGEVLARAPAPDRALLEDTMGRASAEARRASEVVRRLRDFYQSGAVELTRVAPASLIESSVRAVLGRAERCEVRIATRIAAPLPDVTVDALQAETVLQNVLNNAIDALADQPGEKRTIDIRAVAAANRVTITVRDSGPGVPPQVVERLFEPFTTTKANGMGLGLAISRSLIHASGGEIRFDDRGPGACFVIALPTGAGVPA
jgi:two-component system, LuxR family, sensor kinase FixL